MGDGLGLYMKDLYPNMGIQDTSNSVTPDADDQDALGEMDKELAEKGDLNTASKFNIYLAIILIALAVIFLGAIGR
ncbi:hypothetical protein [Clostridioides sp. ZZV15-6598]|uniref:hypothetical protein n=1 Tax=Clostridioides sp. ZZV15-6598 TaxID=2811501 RepID=UPI001D111AEF|nr:hypothetical protein [Clostridioides sp. ZZV15-6598]